MIRSLTLYTTLALPLLLGACGKKDEAADSPVAAQADAQPADAQQADNGPPEAPAESFWPAIAPLVAGTYQGECLQLPEMKTQAGSITLTADGKASAAGIASDLSKSTTIVLSRHSQDGGHSTLATMETDGGASKVHFQLQAEAKAADSKATLLLGDRQLSCTKVGAMDQLNAKPLHASLAKLIDASSQNMKCVSTSNLLSQSERSVQVAGGVVTVGDEKFQLDKAEFETVTLTDGSNGFSYAFKISEAQQLNLLYNGAGKLVSAMGVTIGDKKHICGVAG